MCAAVRMRSLYQKKTGTLSKISLVLQRSPVCLCSAENIPARNSDVDYRLLEAAKAGDLDTVKVACFIFFSVTF